jgi:hydroxyethylthiazole kinase-like uncharacterized protein yjeF
MSGELLAELVTAACIVDPGKHQWVWECGISIIVCMSEMSRWVYRPEHVRELDRIAIEEQGIPGYELMCRAGVVAYQAMRDRYPQGHVWLIICGSGNNGGDGYVIARLALADGLQVRLIALADPTSLSGDAAIAWQEFVAAGGHCESWTGPDDLHGADVIVDALLGTGLQRPLSGAYLEVVETVNAYAAAHAANNVAVLAVDIPSGLSGTTGAVLGAVIRADLTATFVGLKQGLFLGQGPDNTGELVYGDLSIAPIAIDRVSPTLRVFEQADFRAVLPPRERTGHKGSYGHVLVIGGNVGMAGAARLTGEAALRTGAGLVSVATRAANVAAIIEGRPELMARGVESADELLPMLEKASVIALGPGLGQDGWAQQMFAAALTSGKPLVIDADALNLLAAAPQQRSNWILTPHPGEAGRLLGVGSGDIQADRLNSLAEIRARYGGAVVLKGHGTLIGGENDIDDGDGERPWLIRGGNPGMGTAGMGDVLTGITAAIYAQAAKRDSGLSVVRIAAAAAWLHAAAGDRAAAVGERGLVAGDLFAEIRACANS